MLAKYFFDRHPLHSQMTVSVCPNPSNIIFIKTHKNDSLPYTLCHCVALLRFFSVLFCYENFNYQFMYLKIYDESVTG